MSKLFGGAPPPPLPEVPVAPIPDDEQIRIARQRKFDKEYGKRGRQGTVLSRGSGLS